MDALLDMDSASYLGDIERILKNTEKTASEGSCPVVGLGRIEKGGGRTTKAEGGRGKGGGKTESRP
jgi:hypothetical protein